MLVYRVYIILLGNILSNADSHYVLFEQMIRPSRRREHGLLNTLPAVRTGETKRSKCGEMCCPRETWKRKISVIAQASPLSTDVSKNQKYQIIGVSFGECSTT